MKTKKMKEVEEFTLPMYTKSGQHAAINLSTINFNSHLDHYLQKHTNQTYFNL